MRKALELQRHANFAINCVVNDDERIMRMIQCFSEEAHIVEAQLADGIEALEQIAAIAQRALGKSNEGK
ncbi:hypothetical protein [Paenibacillus albus]|uniref:Uncharacterized protein n=1 Tax=Paenibacillus albus TaxID=2495582 RepID=A0A3S9ACG3_9BACL|nr:hypothetical protein [Paenibacillus albus]AZN43385.1 hypothetical protein EJC50_29600 [Paenibacillus albus]